MARHTSHSQAPTTTAIETVPAGFSRSAKIVLTVALTLATGAVPLLLPGTATAETNLVTDGFDRSVASGWGTSLTGGAWNVVGGSTISVNNSEGKVTNIAAGRSFRAYLPATAGDDTEVQAEFTVPVSKDFIYTVESRKQADSSSYFGRARIDPLGKMHIEVIRFEAGTNVMLKELTLATPVPVGQKLVLKLSTKGVSPVIVQGKVFVAGETEPGWQVTGLDSSAKALTNPGYSGVQAYNGGTNAAVNPTTQAFTVTDIGIDEEPSASPSGPVDPSASPTSSPTPVVPPKLNVKHGAEPVGSLNYPVPSNALFVSPSGSDTNTGTLTSPFKTVMKALTKNFSGQTIVLRGGIYHESVAVYPGHAATIQPYPNEAVWFDGTRLVEGFQASGNGYVAPWTNEFDSSPTYTKGAPDSPNESWQFVNPAYPMAAHPDMVWIDNTEQKQVQTRDKVVAGTFYMDYAADKLYLGTNPAGKSVRSADLQSAFSLRAPGTVLRGFGIRRFGNSVWQQGVITSYYDRMTLDNMTVLDSATSGIGFYRPDSVIKNTTVDGSGQLGIQASLADNLVMDNVSVQDSNDERFNPAPSAGGIKITTTRGVTLKNSEIVRTIGNQFWADQSVYDTTVTGNEILDGSRWGVVLEISSTATVADNIIANNAYDGLMVQNTDKVNIWNNTIVNNRRAIAIVQDSRRITQLNVSGHDPRRAQPDMTMPWTIGDTSVGNNVLSAGRDATYLFGVESYASDTNASDINVNTNGNVYSQTAYGTPGAAAYWARKGNQPYHYLLLDDFVGNTGQEKTSINPIILTPVDTAFQVKSTITSKAGTVAQPLPSAVALKTGQTAGVKLLGAQSRPTAP